MGGMWVWAVELRWPAIGLSTCVQIYITQDRTQHMHLKLESFISILYVQTADSTKHFWSLAGDAVSPISLNALICWFTGVLVASDNSWSLMLQQDCSLPTYMARYTICVSYWYYTFSFEWTIPCEVHINWWAIGTHARNVYQPTDRPASRSWHFSLMKYSIDNSPT